MLILVLALIPVCLLLFVVVQYGYDYCCSYRYYRYYHDYCCDRITMISIVIMSINIIIRITISNLESLGLCMLLLRGRDVHAARASILEYSII